MLLREFFDRKRFGALKSVCSRSGNRKGLSQDLLALHTVSRAHSKNKQDEPDRKTIKKIDLDRFQSCTRPIEEVDMGPSSPTRTPSRILLMDSKSNLNKSVSYKSETGTPEKESFNSFLKPTISKSLFEKTEKSEKLHHSKSPQIHTTKKSGYSLEADHMKDDLGRNQNSKHSDGDRNIHQPSFSFTKYCKNSYSSKNNLNSEDFLITPLGKYAKPDPPEEKTFKNSKKRGYSQSVLKEQNTFGPTPSKPKHTKTSPIDTYLTSTPLKASDKVKHRSRSKREFSFSDLGMSSSFSPIQKLSKQNTDQESGWTFRPKQVPDLEDDFRYLPRPMVGTPESFKVRSQTPVFNDKSNKSSIFETNDSDVSLQSKMSWKYKKSKFGSDSDLYESETILNNTRVKEKDVSETTSKESFSKREKRTNIFSHTCSEDPVVGTFKEVKDCPRMSTKYVNEKSGCSSLLLQYRQKFLQSEDVLNPSFQHERDIKCSDLRKSEVYNSCEETRKFFPQHSDPVYRYKPFKELSAEEAKKLDIMKFYQTHKETHAPENSLLLNETEKSQSVPNSIALEVTENHVETPGIKTSRLSEGGAVNGSRSPEVGAEYPSHLNYQSKAHVKARQTLKQESRSSNSAETDEWNTPTNKDGKMEGKVTEGDKNRLSNSHMEEVLQEMKELEQQDSLLQDEVELQESCKMSAIQAEPSTEQSEIDCYLESEIKFWNFPHPDNSQSDSGADKTGFTGNTVADIHGGLTEVHDEIASTALPLASKAPEIDKNELARSKAIHGETEMKKFVDKQIDMMKSVDLTLVDVQKQNEIRLIESSENCVIVDSGTQMQIDVIKIADKAKSLECLKIDKTAEISNGNESESLPNCEMNVDDCTKLKVDCDVELAGAYPSSEKSFLENKFKTAFKVKHETQLNSKQIPASSQESEKVNTAEAVPTTEGKGVNDADPHNISLSIMEEETTAPNKSSELPEEKSPENQVSDKPESLEIVSVENQSHVRQLVMKSSKKTDFKMLHSVGTKPYIADEKLCKPDVNLNVNDMLLRGDFSKNSTYSINPKTETYMAEMDTLQDPHVSSGCNKSIQTDTVQCIDVASSPFIRYHPQLPNKSVGVQCNFPLDDKKPAVTALTRVPQLGMLATSLLGSSYKKGLNFVSFLSSNLGSSSSEISATPSNENGHEKNPQKTVNLNPKTSQFDKVEDSVTNTVDCSISKTEE